MEREHAEANVQPSSKTSSLKMHKLSGKKQRTSLNVTPLFIQCQIGDDTRRRRITHHFGFQIITGRKAWKFFCCWPMLLGSWVPHNRFQLYRHSDTVLSKRPIKDTLKLLVYPLLSIDYFCRFNFFINQCSNKLDKPIYARVQVLIVARRHHCLYLFCHRS